MSMFGNLAFAAIDNYLKMEVQKFLDRWLTTAAVHAWLEKIPDSGRPVPIPVKGVLHASITSAKVAYTGTAMRKTEERELVLPDFAREIPVDRVIPARPGAETAATEKALQMPPSAVLKLHLELILKEPGIRGGMGGISADVHQVSFTADLSGEIN